MNHNVITEDDARRAAPAGTASSSEEETPGGARAAAGPTAVGTPLSKDDAFDRLFKYIPSITVGTYLAIQGVVVQVNDADTRKYVLLGVAVVMLVGTYLYLRQRGVRRSTQIGASLGAFVVWVFALGGPFDAFWGGWEEWMGSIALFLGAFLLVAWNPPPLPET